MKKAFLWVLGIAAVVIFTLVLSPKGQSNTNVLKPGHYDLVQTFKGNGVKQSEPFKITGSKFKIEYDCNGVLCQAFLNNADGTLRDLLLNQAGSISSETVFTGRGDFQIETNVVGSFEFRVYDYR